MPAELLAGLASKENILFTTVIPMAKFKSRSKKTGKTTEQLCTLNNFSRWGRFGKTEIKNEYKQLLKDFFLPEPQNKPADSMILVYKILRHNKRKLDTDNIIYNIKWSTDILCDMGWLSDDDHVTVIIQPTEYVENLNETQIKLTAYK